MNVFEGLYSFFRVQIFEPYLTVPNSSVSFKFAIIFCHLITMITKVLYVVPKPYVRFSITFFTHPGATRDIQSKCKYDESINAKTHNEITWSHPTNGSTTRTGYRVLVRYTDRQVACFQLPAHQNTFIFNKTIGFLYGCSFRYSFFHPNRKYTFQTIAYF